MSCPVRPWCATGGAAPAAVASCAPPLSSRKLTSGTYRPTLDSVNDERSLPPALAARLPGLHNLKLVRIRTSQHASGVFECVQREIPLNAPERERTDPGAIADRLYVEGWTRKGQRERVLAGRHSSRTVTELELMLARRNEADVAKPN